MKRVHFPHSAVDLQTPPLLCLYSTITIESDNALKEACVNVKESCSSGSVIFVVVVFGVIIFAVMVLCSLSCFGPL